MSLNSGETTIKKSRDDGGSVEAPTAKRQKSNDGAEDQHSLLLEMHPEILRKVYSFLELKEALFLRQTNRRFNNASRDIFQYRSFIMNDDALEKRGFVATDRIRYTLKQETLLCNLPDAENLRAVLRNETLDPDFVRRFMHYLVWYNSTTDNAQALTVLLEDERCKVNVDELEKVLRQGFSSMAAVLQQDERIKKDIQMCETCSNNIGCYKCSNGYRCGNDGSTSRGRISRSK